MPKPFAPDDVARHRTTYKVILADGRRFVNTTTIEDFTRERYKKHLTRIFDQIGAELGTIEEDQSCPPSQKKPLTPSSSK